MWDERYSTDDYAYGREPNDFLVEAHSFLPKGRVLSLAEGEGRNAVFLARLGYRVTAVDASAVGLRKAARLAEDWGVSLNLVQADLTDFELGQACWEGIVSIFCPLPSALRTRLHRKVVAGLAPGGIYLLEAYTPDQLRYGTGGGSSADHMTTRESLLRDLDGLEFLRVETRERRVVEGRYHTGLASVVQTLARKPVLQRGDGHAPIIGSTPLEGFR